MTTADVYFSPKPPEPTVGRIVHYRLSISDCAKIDGLRAVAGYGNTMQPGDVVPLVVVRPWHQPGLYSKGESVLNGQALVDGPFTLWVLSAREGDAEGCWFWPPRG